MDKLLQNIRNLNQLVLQGKAMEAFEQYYDEQVVMQENALPPTIGKTANRQRELEFFGNVTDLRAIRALDVTVGDNVTMVVWHYDYTHREWGEKNYTQVSVQHWRGDKIVREQFFYDSVPAPVAAV
ncbi:nuclear transport factor 2 family protein [Spirosoma sp. BT702]|uniref:Nuclear transport factor 2 family protein n=1 Tax=Spirosoma profusum TaxID=2771354 RepID=A0A927AP20_9BACT|nr:nuclear transport factor 2 family protein [Spirosoma profusum]MBD2703079.1 nuclear transport factor 2 family protein [Spirosoma profusum]